MVENKSLYYNVAIQVLDSVYNVTLLTWILWHLIQLLDSFLMWPVNKIQDHQITSFIS